MLQDQSDSNCPVLTTSHKSSGSTTSWCIQAGQHSIPSPAAKQACHMFHWNAGTAGVHVIPCTRGPCNSCIYMASLKVQPPRDAWEALQITTHGGQRLIAGMRLTQQCRTTCSSTWCAQQNDGETWLTRITVTSVLANPWSAPQQQTQGSNQVPADGRLALCIQISTPP